jgi:NADP-dependent 3-hydroxy acid dehydrogenase YdfG
MMKGKVAYITGGTKGIGLGVVEALLDRGMRVAFSGRSQDSVSERAQQLEEKHTGRVLGIASNVVNAEDEIKAVKQIKDKWGQVDVVLANAGVGHFAPIDEMKHEDWKNVIDTNLHGVFHTLKASVEELKSSKGYFMTLASLAGTNFFENGAAYNASKFGVVGFTQAVMLDLRKYGIKTTTIMPGSVATHFNGHVPNPDDAWKIQPEDLGLMVAQLLEMDHRTLPSKVEVRPTQPPSAQ